MGFFQTSGILNRRGFFGESKFSPKNISSLDLWLDAADGNTLYSSVTGGSLVTTNGSAVKRWEDKSGNGLHATESTNAPTLSTSEKNNLNGLNFSTNKLLSIQFSSKTFTEETIFVVMKFSTSAANYARAFTQTVAGSSDFAITGHYIPILRNATNNQLGSYASSDVRSSVSVSDGTWYLARARHSGSALTVKLNNTEGASYSHTLNRNFDFYQIGTHNINGDSAFWNGIITEVIVYTKNLSNSESDLITNYLNSKWAIY